MIKTGTLESSDCMIELREDTMQTIDIDSIVFEQFGDQIKTVILDVLEEYDINQIHVKIVDKGALDYTIKARLKSALDMWGERNG